MTQDNLFEKLYGEPEARPTEEPTEEPTVAPPHLKSRSGRAYLETLKNGSQPTNLRATDTGSAPG